MQNWKIEDLKKVLNGKQSEAKIQKWRIVVEDLEREERYLIRDDESMIALDQSRTVQRTKILVQLSVQKQEKELGSAEQQFYPSLNLIQQLNALMERAQLGKEEEWSLPEIENKIGDGPNRADPSIWENVHQSAEAITSDLMAAIRSTNSGEFNSAELFVAKEKQSVMLSNGFVGSECRSRIFHEVCFSNKDEESGLNEEFLLTKWVAGRDQLKLAEMCSNSAYYAKSSLYTEKPEAGNYSVLVDSETISQLLNDVISQLRSDFQYLSMPFIPAGEEFIPSYSGTNFNLSIDPLLVNSFDSRSFSLDGLPQERMLLVEKNIVKNNLTTKKMADYLNKTPSTVCGAIVVDSEGASVEELRKSEAAVLEILQFSGLFSSPQNLTFSSEIRLARLYDNINNTVTYIKGGSISGNFKENFSKVRWSSEKEIENSHGMMSAGSYSGPKYALLNDVSVSA